MLMRALRMNPGCQELYLFFFQMEMQYLFKIGARQKLLGLEYEPVLVDLMFSEKSEVEIKRIEAITRNLAAGDQDDKEFERRLKVAQAITKDKEAEAKINVNDPARPQEPNQPSQRRVQRPVQPPVEPRREGSPFGGEPQ